MENKKETTGYKWLVTENNDVLALNDEKEVFYISNNLLLDPDRLYLFFSMPDIDHKEAVFAVISALKREGIKEVKYILNK